MSRSHHTATRAEAKALTHAALLRAALKLLSRQSFDAISLREVTKEAGISPTAFYRHFDDMEELGLELVEESFVSLRSMLRDARGDLAQPDHAVRRSIQTVVAYTRDHKDHFRFIARERYGGVKRIRRAIHHELTVIIDELAADLATNPVGNFTVEELAMGAHLIVETVVSMVAELLEAHGDEIDAITRRTEQQLMLVILGAAAWNPRRP